MSSSINHEALFNYLESQFITIAELSRRSGLAYMTVYNAVTFMGNKPRKATLSKILKALELTPDKARTMGIIS
jgi:predicted transcriptional regulator